MADDKTQNQQTQEESIKNDLLNAMGINRRTEPSPADTEREAEEAVGETENDPELPTKKEFKKSIALALCMIVFGIGVFLIPRLFGDPEPPAKDVVASYSDKVITTDELKQFLQQDGIKSQEHIMCEIHGYDHSLCSPQEPCEQHPLDNLEGYRQAVQMMAVEQIILDWAEKKGLTAREDVQHGITDLVGDANAAQMLNQIHQEEITPESISKWEIQQYYDNNKDIFGDKTLDEVEEEIRSILLTEKDANYFPDYIEKLKESAGLEFNAELLKVTEPSSQEIKAYYEANREKYKKSASANVQEIRLADEKISQEAVKKLNSGETFEQVAEAYGVEKKLRDTVVAQAGSGSSMEEAVFRLSKNEVSSPIANEDGTYSIVKMGEITAQSELPLKEAEPQIRDILLEQNMDREYNLKKDEALFSVHSRRYTLGDFYTEYKELNPGYQKEYRTYEKKKELVEQLIAKELLLEENGDGSEGVGNEHDLEELKIQYLMQVMHQEEVDQKLEEATEDEMTRFYEENEEIFQVPEKAKLNLIWIAQTEDESGRQRIQEAKRLLDEGNDFTEVAKQYSEDGTAVNGGVLEEWFYQGHLLPELVGTVFQLTAGEISKVIETQDGYYIIQMREKENEQTMPYEESKELIATYVKEQKHLQMEQDMESEILEDANLIVYDKTLRRLLNEKEEV